MFYFNVSMHLLIFWIIILNIVRKVNDIDLYYTVLYNNDKIVNYVEMKPRNGDKED